MRDVIGYEGLYAVTKEGRVWSYRANRFMKTTPDSKGYVIMDLNRNGKRFSVSLHRLIAIAFVVNPNNLPVINHKNGIKSDNRAENLEWCTQSENNQHAYDTGLAHGMKGTKHWNVKLIESNVIEIRNSVSHGVRRMILAKKFGVTRTTIGDIIRRRSWTHI